MKPKIYLETSIVSYLTAQPSRDIKHLANAAMRSKIEVVCRLRGFEPCVICTPEELLED